MTISAILGQNLNVIGKRSLETASIAEAIIPKAVSSFGAMTDMVSENLKCTSS